MRVLVDADYIAHTAAHLSQIKNGHFSEEPEFIDLGPEKAYEIVDTLVRNLRSDTMDWFKNSGEHVDLALFVSGKNNFRYELAKIKPYKGNRTGKDKPVNLGFAFAYLKAAYGAITCEGQEADDGVATAAAELGYDPDRVCIISNDKDLRTVPGMLINQRTKEAEFITEEDALYNFYHQVLAGDVADNVGGCWGVGDVKAHKILNENPSNYWGQILRAYSASTKVAGCPYADWKDPQRAAIENAQLLHLRRKPGEVWAPPFLASW